MDVRNKRSADAGSDHLLLIGKVKLRICSNKIKAETRHRKKYRLEKLKANETKRQWTSCIEERNRHCSYDNGNIEEMWEKIKQTIHQAAEEVLGNEEEGRKEWITENTWNLIKQRKNVKAKLNEAKTTDDEKEITAEYQNLNTQVKKSARHDKRMWINNMTEKAEEAAQTNNLRELYRNTKIIAKKNYKQDKPIQSKDGNMITATGEQLVRWQEYYEELLKEEDRQDKVQNLEENEEIGDRLEVIESEPTREEIREAVKNMRNGKSPGIDKLWKADLNYTVEMLTPLIQEIWKQEQMPQEWTVFW